jgi:hypothetical protein
VFLERGSRPRRAYIERAQDGDCRAQREVGRDVSIAVEPAYDRRGPEAGAATADSRAIERGGLADEAFAAAPAVIESRACLPVWACPTTYRRSTRVGKQPTASEAGRGVGLTGAVALHERAGAARGAVFLLVRGRADNRRPAAVSAAALAASVPRTGVVSARERPSAYLPGGHPCSMPESPSNRSTLVIRPVAGRAAQG